ncbi:hypothetical protein C8R45DRAFT_1155953 [Mycena sanguinolenta]|nr:hypothetical protein C8R45DRAFT_1155953 [Mycena sanguinolenta]
MPDNVPTDLAAISRGQTAAPRSKRCTHTIPPYPPYPIVLEHLCDLILEIIPLQEHEEEWQRIEEPFLTALTLPVLCSLTLPEIWFLPDACVALHHLKVRSGCLPQQVWVTAVPPGQWVAAHEEYVSVFPDVTFHMRSTALPSSAPGNRWDRCYSYFSRGYQASLVIYEDDSYYYDSDYSDHRDYLA